MTKQNLQKMLAAPGVRMKSPINLLTGPESAYLRWADENRSFQTGMAASWQFTWQEVFETKILANYFTSKMLKVINSNDNQDGFEET